MQIAAPRPYYYSATRSLSTKQLEVLAFIEQCVARNGYPPTIREMGRHFAWSSPHCGTDYLRRLEAKGAIVVDRNVARGIRVVKPSAPRRLPTPGWFGVIDPPLGELPSCLSGWLRVPRRPLESPPLAASAGVG